MLSCNVFPTDKTDTSSGPLDDIVVISDCLAGMAAAGAHWVSSNSWAFTDPMPATQIDMVLLRDAIQQHVCKMMESLSRQLAMV